MMSGKSPKQDAKYDNVKVKVWLDGTHHYVLSRFLVSRRLTATQVPADEAVNVSLALKKHLVDEGLSELSQADLEHHLFRLLSSRGFGRVFLDRYRLIDAFHRQRIPLVALLFGPPLPGGTGVAMQLASRLNMPHVVHVDLMADVLRASGSMGFGEVPPWEDASSSGEDVVDRFRREGQAIAQAMRGELEKALRDGKCVIFEGTGMDPAAMLRQVTEVARDLGWGPALGHGPGGTDAGGQGGSGRGEHSGPSREHGHDPGEPSVGYSPPSERSGRSPIVMPCLLLAGTDAGGGQEPATRVSVGMAKVASYLRRECEALGVDCLEVDPADSTPALDTLHQRWLALVSEAVGAL